MSQRLWSMTTWLLVASDLLSACGGTAQKSAASSPPPVTREAEASEQIAPAPVQTGPDCNGGVCFVCGGAVCPKGFFCDESTSKPTCQNVPTCTTAAADCACVARALSSKCSCTERAGGTYVHCSE